MEVSEIVNTTKKRLSNEAKQHIMQELLAKSIDGKVMKGVKSALAAQHEVSVRCITHIWQYIRKSQREGVTINVDRKMAGKVGKKTVIPPPFDLTNIELHRRKSIRSLAKAMGKPKTNVHRFIQKGLIKVHTNAIKPFLTDSNMTKRLEWAISHIVPQSMPSHPVFEPMFNCVHVDEKWFYMTQVSPRYYLGPDEAEPYRTCKSKRFITKVMFLCVVARPRYSQDSELLFDGKIGIFPFTEFQAAKRNSKNRTQGTIEEKAIDSVNKDVYREYLLRKVIPAIKAKWPIDASGDIYIQQDNARPHIHPDDSEFMAVATTEGFNIKLSCQPSNSPDLNVLDLGFFRSVECLQQANRSKTVSELVATVIKAYDDFSPYTLNKVWLSLQLCMREILTVKGNNNYKMPHIGKDSLHAHGELPISIHADATLVREAMEVLANGSTEP